MQQQHRSSKESSAPQPQGRAREPEITAESSGGEGDLLGMQETFGNAFAVDVSRSGSSGSGDADALSDRMKGSPGPLPFREEMEAQFGEDFSDVHAWFGQVEEMQRLGAHAAASGEVIAFDTLNPSRAQVQHELTHVVQGRRGQGQGSSQAAESEAESASQAGSGAVDVDSAPGAAIQLDQNDTLQDAIRRAREINDAFHGSMWSEDEERALSQIRGQSTLMLREIRAQYQTLYGKNLESEFRSYCNEAQTNEALRTLWGTMSLSDRIRSNVEPGWLWDSANEQGILDTIRSASQADRTAAGNDTGLMTLIQSHLNDEEWFQARQLLQPGRLYEIVVERIRSAQGWFNDDEGAAYDAVMALSVADRSRLWEENQDIFGFMSEVERGRARRMCLGDEAQALEARMEAATDGWGTDDDAVHEVAARTGQAAQEQQQLQTALASGNLSAEDRARAEARLEELGAVNNLLRVRRDDDGEVEEDTFLGNLRGDVSEEEYRSMTAQMGVNAFEQARQSILDAIGFFNDDENAVYEAFDRVTDPALRQRLWDDPLVKEAMSHLNREEQATATAFRDHDTFTMAVQRLDDAWHRMNADENRILEIIAGMSEEDRQRLRSEEIFTSMRQGMSDEERVALDEVVASGRVSAQAGIDAALGGDWDGTNKDLLNSTFRNMGDDDRWIYRLGYYLDRERMPAADPEQQSALDAFRALEARLESELGTDDLQQAMDNLIGVPTARELQDEAGRLMAAGIMNDRIDDKQALWGGLAAGLTETDETADRMEVQFDAAYAQAMEDGTITEEELAVLANLDQRFAERYQESVQASDMIANIAATVAAVAAGIVVTVLTGGTAGPVVGGLLAQYGAAALAGGVAGAVARVGTSELMGGDHFDTMSSEGATQAVAGFADGAMAVLSAGLAGRFTNLIGLKGAQLSGQVTVGAIDAAGGALQTAGKQFVAGAVRGGLDGLISGVVGEVVLTASDEATWRRSVWDVVSEFGAAILRGGTVGAVTGGLVGGGMEALGAFMQRSRIESMLQDLDASGIPRSQIDTLSVDTVRKLGQLDAAFAASDMVEAQRLLTELGGEVDAGRLRMFEACLTQRYLGAGALASQGLENVAGAADVLRAGFRASSDDLSDFRALCSDPSVAAWFKNDLGGSTVDEWYDAIVARIGPNHPAATSLSPEELVAVYGYTTNFYTDLNGAMRSLDDAQLERLMPFLKTATSGLNAMPNVEGVLTRRMRSVPGFIDELLQPGNVFSDRAFGSSSMRDDLTQFGTEYIVTIHGRTGAAVYDFSAFADEAEVLFSPGARFRVVRRWNQGGTVRVILEEML